MKMKTRLGLAAAFAALIAAPMAFAQGDAALGQMMQGDGMMGGEMSGMQGMMGMMQMMNQMGPMMEACTEMMQETAHHRPDHHDGVQPPSQNDAAPAPQDG